jgi:hypothetical protein
MAATTAPTRRSGPTTDRVTAQPSAASTSTPGDGDGQGEGDGGVALVGAGAGGGVGLRAHRLPDRGQLVLQHGEGGGEVGIGGPGGGEVGTGQRHDAPGRGEVVLDRRGDALDGRPDVPAQAGVPDGGEHLAERRLVRREVLDRAGVLRAGAGEQRLQHVAADGVVHHVRLQRRAGGAGGGEQDVGALPRAVQRRDGQHGEGGQRQRTGGHQDGELDAERAVGPGAVHVGLREVGRRAPSSSHRQTVERLQRNRGAGVHAARSR